MAWPHHKSWSDGTIWTNGTTRHSSNQKKTICWSHSATPNNQTSQSGLRMDTRRWQEEGRMTKEDMARHTERRYGHIRCWLEWCERYCQQSCQMETTCRPIFCSEWEELSLSLSKYYNGRSKDHTEHWLLGLHFLSGIDFFVWRGLLSNVVVSLNPTHD